MRTYVASLVMLLSGLYLYHRIKKYNLKSDFSCVIDSECLVDDLCVPYKVRDRLGKFLDWDTDFFRENYGDEIIYVLNSKNKECSVRDARLLKMQLKEYIDEYIRGKLIDKRKFYFKSEDSYKFLSDIGLDRRIEDEFKSELPWHIRLTYSFWMGPKGSTTTFHYDTDYTNFLCVLEGRKRVFFVPPRGEYRMTTLGADVGDYWTNFDPTDEERVSAMKDNNELCEIVLEKGDILNIPKNVWHAVINMEDSVAFTFHYYTLESVILGSLYRTFQRVASYSQV